MGKHALLSASSSHRWLACPPSARLCENYEDKGSEYAQEGTDAHSLCEHKLKLALGMASTDPTENLSYYNEEMEQCACDYVAYVLELVEEAKKTCKDPVVLVEQRLDFSRFVAEGFGTGDCVIIADGILIHHPVETWGSGKHILSLYYPIDNLVPNITNTFNVYLRMENGTGEIETGACIASISGQAMAAAAAWDGKITVEETAALFRIGGGLDVKGYTDMVQMETMELVQKSYADSIGKAEIGAFGKPFAIAQEGL